MMIIHGNRLESLRELVVAWMRRYPLAPLENEVVLVQSNGIAQWLQQALAADPSASGGGGCGIAAALDVQLPARLQWQAYRAVLGADAVPVASPLDKAPLTWRLVRLLPTLLDKPVYAPLQRFMADDVDCRKRYQLAERLADLFDQYQVYRADWLADWSAGHDRIRGLREGPGLLAEADTWQPALWRALLEDVGEQRLADSRVGIHPQFIKTLGDLEQRPQGLPRRVIVFGISSLPAQSLEALAAMSRFSQVLLCVLNPCQHHWSDIVADQDLLRHAYQRQARRPGMPVQLDDASLHQHAHPLLAAWGKQGRDYINLLDSHDERSSYEHLFRDITQGRIDLFEPPPRDHLLGQLQHDILDLAPLNESRDHWPPVDPARDQSVRFHSAHSAQREVQVLHDQLLAWFSEDTTLRPRDIIVMVPDIDLYAASVQAVFGQYAPGEQRYIPFTLADQGQRGREPLLIALEHLLGLPDSRLPVSEVLDLLDVPALRARFAIAEADLPMLRRWLDGAGIRWGLDARRREALGLSAGLDTNTWRFGLRRMLLGYASGSGEALAGIEPYDEIGGLDAALIGPLVQLLDALDDATSLLTEPASPARWGERLRALLAQFFVPGGDRDERLLTQLQTALDQWLELCDSVALEEALPLNVVREAWLAAVEQSPLNQRFLAGAVNVCTLMPMRAIPFRRVCLLGMNDGDYPRAHVPLDFDLMARDYRPGDRSRREDDRYLALEALLSARERLYISWVGHSIRDNSERPPSVLVGQLRDHFSSGWRCANDADLLAALTTCHPLQPFSPAYFDGLNPALFSYAREWLPMHRAGSDAVRAAVTGQAALPPLLPEAPLEVPSVQRFLRDPAAHFFSGRFNAWLDTGSEAQDDAETFALDGLQLWQLRQQVLAVAGQLPPQADMAEVLESLADGLQRAGQLPLAGFGALARAQVLEPLAAQLQQYQGLLQQWPLLLDSPLVLADGIPEAQLESWLGGLRSSPDGASLARLVLLPGKLLGKSPKKLRWHSLLNDWVVHVLAAASGRPINSYLVATDAVVHLQPLPREVAREQLQWWLRAWLAGLCEPLPCAPQTAFAWLEGLEKGEEQAAAKACLVFDGNGAFNEGEVARSTALASQYPDFNALSADGRFSEYCEGLYAGLLQAFRAEQITFAVTPGALEDDA
ncbi:exodeoxyribonuclease V subunit gamma [Kineobactrum sediminis]|uniref:RecBCD enzyme subunit RecC n=2 Tax=Kineobactrum sediminis TaxID=1905677 RepID=A0A2N5Y2B9_9GAMM|nr:exodeoxyribonuclease V subunit gamma [Kineobactrum sediminis]